MTRQIRPGCARRGLANGKTKLTDEQVMEARRRVADGETQLAVAADLGVSSAHMSRLCRGLRREAVPAWA